MGFGSWTVPWIWAQATGTPPNPNVLAPLALRRWCGSLTLSSPESVPSWFGFWAWVAALSALLLMALGPIRAQDSRLRVDARVAKETYHVGQAIEVRVGVVAEGERPRIALPTIDGAEVEAVDTLFRPVGASGIGEVTSETNVFITRYRVSPTRPGLLTIPPFVARLGERRGASALLRLTIRAVPPEGRPASYLRGVGPLEARAEAVPASIRVGQGFEYRLILTGPGARASTQWPVLPEFDGLRGLKIEPAGTELVADPPSRTFRYRARATEPGAMTLPSVAVATFDPKMDRYVETRAPSVAVRVVDVPRFDASTLPEVLSEGPSGLGTWIWGIPTALIAMAWVTLAVVRRRTSARRLARRVAQRLGSATPDEAAGLVASALKDFLARAVGRPRGELTPDEAARDVGRAVRDPDLAERARRLVERSDRARFGHDAEAASGLAVEASAFFAELARRRAAS